MKIYCNFFLRTVCMNDLLLHCQVHSLDMVKNGLCNSNFTNYFMAMNFQKEKNKKYLLNTLIIYILILS